jgi:hypothetical protein
MLTGMSAISRPFFASQPLADTLITDGPHF